MKFPIITTISGMLLLVAGSEGAAADCPNPVPTAPASISAAQALQCIGSLKDELEALKKASIIPPGAVLAFDLSAGCPSGWENVDDYAGRVLIGAGNGQSLSPHQFRQMGGSETHQHNGTTKQGNKKDGIGTGGTDAADPYHSHDFTTNDGSNMPPFIALYICRKK